MAQSRLEKIGTIFTRVQGLLRGGAMKTEDKPIWYDVYAAFPPKLEPRFDRPAPEIPVRQIFYAEGVVRAKLHKENKPQETISLFDHRRSTQSQQFVQIYQDLKGQGALDEKGSTRPHWIFWRSSASRPAWRLPQRNACQSRIRNPSPSC
uniref:Small ribosomal subunit protein mS23 n=1 Tax=Drosophila melanogaster TaxID=7227 RepID=Q6NP77_DROME|nr:RE74912p [Drosophila melanogaster]